MRTQCCEVPLNIYLRFFLRLCSCLYFFEIPDMMRPGGLLHPDHAVQEAVWVLHGFRVLLVNMRPRNFRLILRNMRPDAGRRPGLGIKVRLHGQHHRRCDTIWNNAQSHALGRCSKLSGKQLLLGWITITLRWIRERSQIMRSWGGRVFYLLFIGFNITVINYSFVALLHWNSHITMGLQKIILCQYFFAFLSIFFHIIHFTLFAMFCQFGSLFLIDILTFS